MQGAAAADQLFGGAGNDTLWGGWGDDYLYGDSTSYIVGYGNELRRLLETSEPGAAAEIQKEFEAAKALSLVPSLIYQPQLRSPRRCR